MFCHKCGAQIADGAKFCHKCGTKVAHAAPEAAAPDDSSANEEAQSFANDFQESDSNSTQSRLVELFRNASTTVKAVTIAVVCIAILILIFLIKALLSFPILLIGILCLAYFLCRPFIEEIVELIEYDKRDHGLLLPDGMDAQGLQNALSGNFHYPYFKGVRCDIHGNCVIEGKYGSYPVCFDKSGKVSLGYMKRSKSGVVLREATAIHSYLKKFFDPALSLDEANDFKRLQSAEKHLQSASRLRTAFRVARGVLLAAAVVGIAILIYSPETIQTAIKPGAEVRGAYLTQYSDTVTIEKAFDNFFDDPKWSTYSAEGYSYVAFTGTCQYAGEAADVRIVFKITGENFRVDQLDINGVQQNDLMLIYMLSTIYEGQ